MGGKLRQASWSSRIWLVESTYLMGYTNGMEGVFLLAYVPRLELMTEVYGNNGVEW